MRSTLGLPGADDPAYAHELDAVARACRSYLSAFDADDFDGCLLLAGTVLGAIANVWKLSPPAGLFDPATLFQREEDA